MIIDSNQSYCTRLAQVAKHYKWELAGIITALAVGAILLGVISTQMSDADMVAKKAMMGMFGDIFLLVPALGALGIYVKHMGNKSDNETYKIIGSLALGIILGEFAAMGVEGDTPMLTLAGTAGATLALANAARVHRKDLTLPIMVATAFILGMEYMALNDFSLQAATIGTVGIAEATAAVLMYSLLKNELGKSEKSALKTALFFAAAMIALDAGIYLANDVPMAAFGCTALSTLLLANALREHKKDHTRTILAVTAFVLALEFTTFSGFSAQSIKLAAVGFIELSAAILLNHTLQKELKKSSSTALKAALFFAATMASLDATKLTNGALTFIPAALAALFLTATLHEICKEQEGGAKMGSFFLCLAAALFLGETAYFGHTYFHFTEANTILMGAMGGALLAFGSALAYEKNKERLT